MTRILATASLATLLAACSATSDDVGTISKTEAAMPTDVVTVCPDAMVLNLEGYAAEVLPTTEDFGVWHVENAARADVQETSSGLQYKVAQAGVENGIPPKAGEQIVAHYHGYFPNGDVFDSSYARGTPLTGPSNGFIKGWNEALADMTVCEARTLYIPADLAYGNSGSGGRPTGTLVFNMQLLNINR